ncbi:hypothetical protein SISNIDRAFT_296002 [Sistotremastrum niveocremeum HHB9708]|uniref:SnoaL-like domain-containing protein n=1 Tax=Sistotremastrum niveocremeum HHB9708 TaxID=1314777 RepID=A0A164NKN1_9AGAM|nr:hypothetical protein SISNIDRAFT_296002 [Sistotremastrum niveocremeum HHB9708]
MSSTTAVQSPQKAAVQKWLDAFGKADATGMLDLLDDSYEHHTFPKSLGRSALNKKENGDRLRGMLPYFEKFTPQILDITEANNKVIAHVTSNTNTTFGVPYTNEYIFTFFFGEGSTTGSEPKIIRCHEFKDSAFAARFLPAFMAAKAKAESKKA